MINLYVKFDEIASAGYKLLQKDDLNSDSDCGLDLECGNLTCVNDTSSHYALSFYEVSLIKLASEVYKLLLRHDLRHNSTVDLTVALTLGAGTLLQKDDLNSDSDCGLDLERGNLTCVNDTSSHYALSFYEVSLIKLASGVYKLLLRHDLRHNSTVDLTVALTLGAGTLWRDTPSRYALSFCEVSLNLLQ